MVCLVWLLQLRLVSIIKINRTIFFTSLYVSSLVYFINHYNYPWLYPSVLRPSECEYHQRRQQTNKRMKNWSFFGFLVWNWSILMGEMKALEYFFTLDLMSQRNAVPILTNWRLRSTIWKPNNFFKFNYRRRRRSIESTWWWFYEKITKSNNWSWLSVAATAWWLRLPVQMGSVEAEIALSIYLVSQSSVSDHTISSRKWSSSFPSLTLHATLNTGWIRYVDVGTFWLFLSQSEIEISQDESWL